MRTLPKLIISLPLAIYMGSAVAEEKTYTFNIPAQSLSSALNAVNRQTGLQPFYADGVVAGKQSPVLKGSYSKRQAVQKLLAQSGLSYTFTSENTVAVKAAPPVSQKANDSTTTLAPMTVVGERGYADTDPYNPNYVQPDATTGTKTDTPIMETPLNVQVITKQVLRDQQVIRLDDALKNVSGVTIDPGFNIGLLKQSFYAAFKPTPSFVTAFGLTINLALATRQMANVEKDRGAQGACGYFVWSSRARRHGQYGYQATLGDTLLCLEPAVRLLRSVPHHN